MVRNVPELRNALRRQKKKMSELTQMEKVEIYAKLLKKIDDCNYELYKAKSSRKDLEGAGEEKECELEEAIKDEDITKDNLSEAVREIQDFYNTNEKDLEKFVKEAQLTGEYFKLLNERKTGKAERLYKQHPEIQYMTSTVQASTFFAEINELEEETQKLLKKKPKSKRG